ncbi:hypothetical protein LCGC14_2737620, partial [marine sediment metagenome]
MPEWMFLVYIWVLKEGRQLEELIISHDITGKLLIAPKETTPPAYVYVSN